MDSIKGNDVVVLGEDVAAFDVREGVDVETSTPCS